MSEHRHAHHHGSRSGTPRLKLGRRHRGRQQSGGAGRGSRPRRRTGCLQALILLLIGLVGLLVVSMGWFSDVRYHREGELDSIQAPTELPDALPAPMPSSR